jgi:hypothetical protein
VEGAAPLAALVQLTTFVRSAREDVLLKPLGANVNLPEGSPGLSELLEGDNVVLQRQSQEVFEVMEALGIALSTRCAVLTFLTCLGMQAKWNLVQVPIKQLRLFDCSGALVVGTPFPRSWRPRWFKRWMHRSARLPVSLWSCTTTSLTWRPRTRRSSFPGELCLRACRPILRPSASSVIQRTLFSVHAASCLCSLCFVVCASCVVVCLASSIFLHPLCIGAHLGSGCMCICFSMFCMKIRCCGATLALGCSYSDFRETFEAFASAWGAAVPPLKEISLDAINEGGNVAFIGHPCDHDDGVTHGLWDDDQMAAFYESLPDLAAVVPQLALARGKENEGEGRSGVEGEEGQGYDGTAEVTGGCGALEDSELDGAEVGEVRAEGGEDERERDEAEKDTRDPNYAALRNILEALPLCTSSEQADEIAVNFCFIQTKGVLLSWGFLHRDHGHILLHSDEGCAACASGMASVGPPVQS